MANRTHLALLRKGVLQWNANRPDRPDLSGAMLAKQNLEGVNLSHANLDDANLSGAMLRRANLFGCSLRNAHLNGTLLFKADLAQAKLDGATLVGATLYRVNFTAARLIGADLSRARLEKATLVAANLRDATLIEADLTECSLSRTIVKGADFSGARVYGAGIWDLRGTPKQQEGLIITRRNAAPVTVDNLKVAQFVYLLLTNPDIRDVIETVTSKAVLILGRFSAERKPVLDALRDALRQRGLAPIVFDFAIPNTRDVTETVNVLAGLVKFIIADITDATEVRAELHNVVRMFPSVPVQPLLLVGKKRFVSFDAHLAKFDWVLPPFEYRNLKHLLANLEQSVIDPAVVKQRELCP